MSKKIRGTHTSPGVYTEITDLSYAVNSMGMTTLGIVGETLKGPAFQPIMIKNPTEFRDYFGGTSPEKYKDSQYPRYELPYIAKSYLKASEQMYVCRVLGLSGYNAGPAFVITADGEDGEKYVVCILRARGSYRKYSNIGTNCEPISKYDTLVFDCDEVKLLPYTNVSMTVNGCGDVNVSSGTTDGFPVNAFNYGMFTIEAYKNGELVGTYPVSLNAGTKDYIYNVLGAKPTEGTAALFVEELYDLYLGELIQNGKTEQLSGEITKIEEIKLEAVCDPVKDFVKTPASELTRNYVGQTFLCDEAGVLSETDDYNGFGYLTEQAYAEKTGIAEGNGYKVDYRIWADSCGKVYVDADLIESPNDDVTDFLVEGFTGASVKLSKFMYYEGDVVDVTFKVFLTKEEEPVTVETVPYLLEGINPVKYVTVPMKVGYIYYVKSFNDPISGKKEYCYFPMMDDECNEVHVGKIEDGAVQCVKVLSYDSYMCMNEDETMVVPVSTVNDYHEQFRCATTPWIVSEIKGDGKNLQVKKLFRFHTISDGNSANEQVKISIANIRPDEGTFDVMVRDFNDSDGAPEVLETYRNLTMVEGTEGYIGKEIGTIDGDYENKSKYIMVEVIANDMTENCVPCGFLGYPTRTYPDGVVEPSITYNRFYDEDIRVKKQYFGMSDITGVDVDLLYYKGKDAYTENYIHGYTKPFHLDSTLSDIVREDLGVVITVDGDLDTAGMSWDAVSPNNVGSENLPPVMSTEADMEGTIYEDIKLRKFTVYPCGGFDGWDIYRNARTTTNDYKANKYKGTIKHGYGETFSRIEDGTSLCLTGNCITSDYYAFLAAANQFENPEKYIINLFATPGIDYVNNRYLTEEIVEMVEDKRFDTFYVMTTPDKPYGSSDSVDEMYSSSDVVDNLEDSAIDTKFASTYYPWIKYYDAENSININLPPTKDVLRNMANVDNKRFPWYAPAGMERGDVECVKMHFFAKLEDEDNVYDGRINPLKTFSRDGVKVWGNKTLTTENTPMNRINTVRLVLYMRKLIVEASRYLIFDPNDMTLKKEFESIIDPLLLQIKKDRGITAYRLEVSQTPEEMDAHELNCKIWIKPTPTLEYIGISFMVTPQGVEFED